MGKREARRKTLFIKWRRTKIVLKVLAILILASVLVRYAILPVVWRIQGNALIEKFEKHPDDETARKLAVLLERHAFSKERGGEVLAMLIAPRLLLREEVPSRHMAIAWVERPRATFYRHYVYEESAKIDAEGRKSKIGSTEWGCAPRQMAAMGAMPASWVAPNSGEKYRITPPADIPGSATTGRSFKARMNTGERRFQWLKPTSISRFPWSIIPRPAFVYSIGKFTRTVYECEVVETATCRFVERDAPVRIQKVSDEILDASIRSMLSVTHRNMSWSRSAAGIISRGTGLIALEWRRLPESVAFEALFRTEDGRLLSMDREHGDPWAPDPFRGRKGQRFYKQYNPAQLTADLQVGSHTGTFILRPDIDLAFYDPAIDTIWDGTLEVPFEFTVQQVTAPSPPR